VRPASPEHGVIALTTGLIATLINRLTYKVGAPIPITGVQFGMRVEFGYDCLIPADFNNDVSLRCFSKQGIEWFHNITSSNANTHQSFDATFRLLAFMGLSVSFHFFKAKFISN